MAYVVVLSKKDYQNLGSGVKTLSWWERIKAEVSEVMDCLADFLWQILPEKVKSLAATPVSDITVMVTMVVGGAAGFYLGLLLPLWAAASLIVVLAAAYGLFALVERGLERHARVSN